MTPEEIVIKAWTLWHESEIPTYQDRIMAKSMLKCCIIAQFGAWSKELESLNTREAVKDLS